MPTAFRDRNLETSNPLNVENEPPDQLRYFSRSPHPYHRQRSEIHSHTERSRQLNEAGSEWSDSSQIRVSCRMGVGKEGEAQIGAGSRRWPDSSKSPSDSGTEADDEGNGFLKGLPAPPQRSRKGLRDARGSIVSTTPSPLLTPSYLEADQRALLLDSISERRSSGPARHSADEEVAKARKRSKQKRRAELVRRSSEVLLLGIIGCIIHGGIGVSEAASYWRIGAGYPSGLVSRTFRLTIDRTLEPFLCLTMPIHSVPSSPPKVKPCFGYAKIKEPFTSSNTVFF